MTKMSDYVFWPNFGVMAEFSICEQVTTVDILDRDRDFRVIQKKRQNLLQVCFLHQFSSENSRESPIFPTLIYELWRSGGRGRAVAGAAATCNKDRDDHTSCSEPSSVGKDKFHFV